MYEATLAETAELFGAYLDGAHSGIVAVVSARPLESRARTALENSAATLGYGRACCTYVTLRETSAAEGAPSDIPLDGQALFLLMEGLDPLVVVAADAEASHALGEAYHQVVPLDAPCRLFGRDAVAFASFESQLDDPQSKQAAWALLKKLPKFGEH